VLLIRASAEGEDGVFPRGERVAMFPQAAPGPSCPLISGMRVCTWGGCWCEIFYLKKNTRAAPGSSSPLIHGVWVCVLGGGGGGGGGKFWGGGGG